MRLYNERLLTYQMDRLGKTTEQLARESSMSEFSVKYALAGRLGTLKKLRQLTDALFIKWEFITNIDLPESSFHRAVLTNGDRRANSVKRG